jgi:L-cysteine/cystine lyase
VVAPFLPDDEKLAAVREALPALSAGIYLNTGSVGPLPAETAAAMDEIAGYELRMGRASVDYFMSFLERLGEARGAIAAVLGADVDQVAVTTSTSAAMNSALWSVPVEPGDRIVTSRSEHPGGLGPVVAVAGRFGAEVVGVDVETPADDAAILAAFDEAIVPGTRVVAISHVLWTTGAKLPIAEIAEIAHGRGAVVAIDAAQAAGAIPVSVGDLGVDYYAVAGQKWLLGPEGSGALWCNPEIVEDALPSHLGWFNVDHIAPGGAKLKPDARRFDAVAFNKPIVTGFARSCGWLSMYVGLPWIHARGTAMARAAADRLAGIDGVEIVTPRDRMATLITFRIAGWTADEIVAELGSRAFAIVRTIPPLDAVRLSVAFFTTEDEVSRVAEVIALLAAHTPATLPPRPRLTVIGQG